LAQLTACLDGLLLQGGTDIEPKRYQETPISPAWPGDPLRDAFEFELLEHWLPSGKPVLGICRGHQLLNVALGGTLYQDLPSQRPAHPAHDIPEKYCALEHSVRLLEHSWLASLYGLRQARVNSAHHQAIKMLAPGMQTEALSDDGLIEAFRDPAHRFLVALQWHPEFHVGELLDPTPMMREFVGACG
jgi:putative glutamine amidotransferase